MAGIELSPRPDKPGARGYETFVKCFEAGVLIRVTGDIIALSPPLIVTEAQIDEMFTVLRRVLQDIA